MNPLLKNISLPIVACTLLLAGCASKASMDARYDASLQRWRGAPVPDLEAAWGKPRQSQATPDGQVLTWTVRIDVDRGPSDSAAPPHYTTTTTSFGLATGPSVTTASPTLPTSAVVPITCTTHFTVKDGRVASWKFEGLGCGAPG
jgi:hypothetical protein